MNAETEYALIKYAFYWAIPLGLIFAEATHRFFRRGRTGIASVLGLIALGLFIFPFVAQE